MNQEKYIERIGLEPSEIEETDLETLGMLQEAHIMNVPWETLSITGDPYSEDQGEEISLDKDNLYEKIVEDNRGGFCFELNGLFNELLNDMGFEADYLSAMVLGDDGAGPPANHLANRVSLDEDYLMDVGMSSPGMRQPITLDGEVYKDRVGVEWRVVESDRIDKEYVTQFRDSSDEEWEDRYVFNNESKDLSYFEATCDFLQSAPESPFTGNTVVSTATEEGYKVLRPDKLAYIEGGQTEYPVDRDNWDEVLEDEFGIEYTPN